MKRGHPPEHEMIEKEKYLRLAADFENYRRRREAEIVDLLKHAGTSIVKDVVDVMDHLDAAVRHAPNNVRADETWFSGLQSVDERFIETMKKFGVTRIETSEQPFDPTTMEAVRMTTGGTSQHVSEEVRAGYLMHGKVIRPARVIVNE